MTERTVSRTEWLVVLAGCTAASLAAAAWSWQHGAMLNYGDAVAHLHIARRVIDSHRPGFSQLGSVWLPLPHLLMIPFVAVYAWWANGIAGLIPSALAWLAACVGMYRLARRWLPPPASALALAFFALNPNLLYMQTTAMTEPLFVCEMIWTTVWLVEWRSCLDAARMVQAQRTRTDRLLYAIAVVARRRGLHALRRLDHGMPRLDRDRRDPGAASSASFARLLDRHPPGCGRSDCLVRL